MYLVIKFLPKSVILCHCEQPLLYCQRSEIKYFKKTTVFWVVYKTNNETDQGSKRSIYMHPKPIILYSINRSNYALNLFQIDIVNRQYLTVGDKKKTKVLKTKPPCFWVICKTNSDIDRKKKKWSKCIYAPYTNNIIPIYTSNYAPNLL